MSSLVMSYRAESSKIYYVQPNDAVYLLTKLMNPLWSSRGLLRE